MPIIKSAKKRVRVARKATIRNAKTKRSLKTAFKNFAAAVSGGGKAAGQRSADAHSKAQSALDKAAKKGIMHKNKVARKKRQLAAKAKASASVAKPAVKPIAKKAPFKKTSSKKTATKKK